MTHVWLVEEGYDYEGESVKSVHASEDGALAAMRNLIADPDEGHVEPWVSCDDPPSKVWRAERGSKHWYAYRIEVEP